MGYSWWFPKESDGLQPPAIMAPVLCSAERKDVADEARKEKGAARNVVA